MIRLEGVTKRYGRFTAVQPLDLEVGAGELFGFLGPNGAGKTTTIRMVTGVLRPTEGRVFIAGHDMLKDPVSAKRHIGYIPDRPSLYEKLTGSEFLRFVSGLWGRDGAAAEQRAGELLELFELTAWRDTLVESYSHGMRQKLLIASALVHSPDIIIVDEPMVGLDPKAARMIKDLLRIFADQGGTVFLSTHTLEVAEALCDRIAILHQGAIRASGTMQELRSEAAAGAAGLEEVFLKLTGSENVKEIVTSLRATGAA
ncbi:MAG TPA: ABC transporter ATP-binding protein [Longimicrobiales bacterium]|jgi:ABC-2 type transport system ATP-binding protein|nr:ABC transporter ATP-binding protein [Longimicrobiales bacterium]